MNSVLEFEFLMNKTNIYNETKFQNLYIRKMRNSSIIEEYNQGEGFRTNSQKHICITNTNFYIIVANFIDIHTLIHNIQEELQTFHKFLKLEPFPIKNMVTMHSNKITSLLNQFG